MATKEFPLTPQAVTPVSTDLRQIKTKLPVPESIPILQKLRAAEPRSMGGQPPIIWRSGDRETVQDVYGNRWIDLSSGVLVTSSGHAHPHIVEAIRRMADQGLYHAYCFPTEVRAELTARICALLPEPLARVFLLTTGSEATECAIKLARTMGVQRGGAKKNILVSFENGFHGRTMGAQLAGGSTGLKSWLGGPDPRFVQVPFPDGFRCPDQGFEVFERSLAEQGVDPDRVCGVIGETYQGCNAVIMPGDYGRALRAWCDAHGVVFIFDEVQAGFGRCGKWFGFENVGVVPDVACFGKGISGGMPLSATVGTEEIMSLYGPGEMTSTHSANPICCAAALANIDNLQNERLVENAAALAPMLASFLEDAKQASNGHIGYTAGTGLVGAMQFTVGGTPEPDPDLAWRVCKTAIERGVLLFAPVGVGGCAIKINPPLTIGEAALTEALGVLLEVVREECR